MARLHSSTVTLRIIGNELIPEEITAAMHHAPDLSYKKGDIEIGKNSGTRVIRKSGMWQIIAQDSEPENIDGQIQDILSKLPQDISIWKSLSGRFRIDVYCGLFMKERNEGPTLSPKTLSALGERGIELGLDINDPLE